MLFNKTWSDNGGGLEPGGLIPEVPLNIKSEISTHAKKLAHDNSQTDGQRIGTSQVAPRIISGGEVGQHEDKSDQSFDPEPLG